MENVQLKYRELCNAHKTLEEILQEKFSTIVRDAAIQRFEYTFEIFWKTIKRYLLDGEGIMVNSPKSCFRELSSTGLISEEDAVLCMEMTDDRNLTSHTYQENLADSIYRKLPEYSRLMKKIIELFNEKLKLV